MRRFAHFYTCLKEFFFQNVSESFKQNNMLSISIQNNKDTAEIRVNIQRSRRTSDGIQSLQTAQCSYSMIKSWNRKNLKSSARSSHTQIQRATVSRQKLTRQTDRNTTDLLMKTTDMQLHNSTLSWPCTILIFCKCHRRQRLHLILTLILHSVCSRPLPLTQNRQTEHIWFHITRVIPSQTHTCCSMIGFDKSSF